MQVFWRSGVRCFAIPKCASSSIAVAFKSKKNFNELHGGASCPTYTFTGIFVRHPLDRLVSCYEDLIVNGKAIGAMKNSGAKVDNFYDFVTSVITMRNLDQLNEHYKDQHLQIKEYLKPKDQNYFMGRVEELDIDWHRFSVACGIQLESIGHRRKSEDRKPWREYYTDTLRDKTEQRFYDDLEMWHNLKVSFDNLA